MVKHVHVIDPDVRRRARVAHELITYSLHAEIYEDVDEFLNAAPTQGVVLAADSSKPHERLVREIIVRTGVDLPVIGYAEAPSTEEVVEAMTAGAAGFLRWPFHGRELLSALQKMWVEGEQRLRRERVLTQARARVEILSPRERQVLTALVAGLSNKQIGQLLKISPRTVEIHRSNMMAKLRALSVADAVKTGLYAGLDEGLSEASLDHAA